MTYDYGKVAGALLLVGGMQFILAMVVAEAAYPGYSISQNYISDLGVGPAAVVFNASVFLLGLMILLSAYLVQRVFGVRLFSTFLALAGLGAMGVGIFPENFGLMHAAVSLVAFLFGGLSAIGAYRLQRSRLCHFSIVLGIFSLAALVLLAAHVFLGLGPGGMERLIAYPILLWEIGFGGYLLGRTQTALGSARSA